MKYFTIFSCAVLLSHCMVFHSGNVSSGPLLSKNDVYVDLAKGSASSIFILGFGDLANNQLIQEAKKNLFLSRPLKKNEYYSNFTSDISSCYILGIVKKIKVHVSAEILSSNDTIDTGFSLSFSKKISKIKKLNKEHIFNPSTVYNGNSIANGDSVYFTYKLKNYFLYVVDCLDKESAVLLSTDKKKRNILVPIENSTFFLKNSKDNILKNGSKIKVKVFDKYYNDYKETVATVIGFGANQILVKTESGYHILNQ